MFKTVHSGTLPVPGPVGKQEIGLQLKDLLSYHLSMKLREGNACLSFCSGGPHMTITYDALDLTVQFPHPSLGLLEIRPGTLPGPGPSPSDIRPGTPWPCLLLVTSSGHHLIPVQTCSFFGPPSNDIWWVATEACMVYNWAVRILLECFV